MDDLRDLARKAIDTILPFIASAGAEAGVKFLADSATSSASAVWSKISAWLSAGDEATDAARLAGSSDEQMRASAVQMLTNELVNHLQENKAVEIALREALGVARTQRASAEGDAQMDRVEQTQSGPGGEQSASAKDRARMSGIKQKIS